MSERIYYSVSSDSPVMSVIRAAEGKQKVFLKALEKLEREFGAPVWSMGNTRFAGIAFKGELPPGWRPQRGCSYAVPNRKTPDGRALAARFAKLPVGVDAMGFAGMLSAALKQEYEHYANSTVAWAWTTCEKWGKVYVLSVPAGCNVKPPQCTELKMSEYWKLRETAEKKKGTAQ